MDVSRAPTLVRAKYLEYWRGLLKAETMATTEMAELIVGTKRQRYYLLAFAARHDLALDFWDKVRSEGSEQQTLLL